MRLMPATLAGLILMADTTLAGDWTSPHPWRRAAAVEGRSFEYNDEAFLQLFSYRHIAAHPGPHEQGLRGTVGSVTAKRALADISFRKRFPFDEGGQTFHLAMQRGEDFDGYYDRQLVGLSQQLGEHWELAIHGDVEGDKAETDVYFQSRWQPDARSLLELTVISADTYFDDKTAREGNYPERPWTFHGRLRLGHPSTVQGELAVNHTPRATFVDQELGVEVSARQSRVAAALEVARGDWLTRLEARGEYSHRDFMLDTTGAENFRRWMHEAGLSVTHRTHRWRPRLGIRHFYLDEEGFFGTASEARGQLHRNEPMLYGDLRLRTGPHQQWEPAIYLSQPDMLQRVDSPHWRDRQASGWRGKLTLPWRYTVDREQNAVLTIAPALKLHEFGFGGGNVQLHWPL